MDGQETMSTNKKIEKMAETQDIDTDELNFFHAVLIKSADKLARQDGERNETRSGGEFRQDDDVQERRHREGNSESRWENSGHVSRCS